MIRNILVRHDGGRVGVEQYHFDALLLQRTAGLGARIVKLRRLSDYDRTGADHQYFLYLWILRHSLSPPSCS